MEGQNHKYLDTIVGEIRALTKHGLGAVGSLEADHPGAKKSSLAPCTSLFLLGLLWP